MAKRGEGVGRGPRAVPDKTVPAGKAEKPAVKRTDIRGDKRRELATYRDLDLDRLHKSRHGRSRVQAGRLYLYVGEGNSERPYLKVLRADYQRVWEQVKAEWEKAALGMEVPYAAFDNLQRTRLENRVYDLLAMEASELSTLESNFLKTQGRRMTPQERSIFSRALEKEPARKPDPQKAAAINRKAILNDLLHKIELKQKDEPGRLQQAWATVVGPEMAMETLLESVDREKGLAICRCLSSTRSFVLRRRKDLPAKLTELLGVRIEKVVFR